MKNPGFPGQETGRRAIRNRGTLATPDNRFARTVSIVDADYLESCRFTETEEMAGALSPETRLHRDASKTIVSTNRSPDIPFNQSINPYKGCEHGCIYCYARPTHGYLELSPGLDFETEIFYKPEAARLLKEYLSRSGYRCEPINIGANTDPYQPVEKQLGLTRQLLQVFLECHHPVTLITKGALIERDMDLLAELAARRLVSVAISLTTLDTSLKNRLEPRASAPQVRLSLIEKLARLGVPVTVLIAPVIPAVNDHELEDLVAAVAAAGACDAEWLLLRLPHEVKDLFEGWLDQHYPERKSKVMALLASCREGQRHEQAFFQRHSGQGVYAELIRQRFERACRKAGFPGMPYALDVSRFVAPGGQMSLW